MEPSDLLVVQLDDSERRVLVAGLNEWGGPARATEELTVALGFCGLDDFHRERARIRQAIEASEPLTRLDWARALLSTEVVFISDLVGAGHDWEFTVGKSDEETLHVIRMIQRRLTGDLRPLIGRGLGSKPE